MNINPVTTATPAFQAALNVEKADKPHRYPEVDHLINLHLSKMSADFPKYTKDYPEDRFVFTIKHERAFDAALKLEDKQKDIVITNKVRWLLKGDDNFVFDKLLNQFSKLVKTAENNDERVELSKKYIEKEKELEEIRKQLREIDGLYLGVNQTGRELNHYDDTSYKFQQGTYLGE